MSPRADARANRAALLSSAARLFTERGPDVPLEAIARGAGVSIATLYRHFPGREELIAETYHREIEQLGEVGPGTGVEALASWLARFVEFARTKRALADLVHALPEGAGPPARETILGALGHILATGTADGTLRADRDAHDALALLAGFWVIADDDEWSARAGRLADSVLDGLRCRSPEADSGP